MSRVAVAAAILLAAAPLVVQAAEGDVVISGTKPSKTTIAPPDGGGRVTLYGPFRVTKKLKDAKGTIDLILDGVTFDPATGNASQFFIVDGKSAAPKIDYGNYVGSAANVFSGQKMKPVKITLELNDFELDGGMAKTRTNFQAMEEFYLAHLVTLGKVQFKKAVLTTGAP